jgi:hypothetical protein
VSGLKKLFSCLVVCSLVACTTVSKENKVFDKPIPPTIHYVYLGEMLSKCYQYVPLYLKLLGAFPFACAEWDTTKNTCDIYISKDAPDWMLEHELEHCKGFGHN